MDSSDSFKSAKVDGFKKQEGNEVQDSFQFFQSIITNDQFSEEDYRRDTRKRIIIIAISSIILVMLIIGAIIGILVPMHSKERSSFSTNLNDSIHKMCNSTLYPDSCYSSISSLKMTSNNPTPDEIFMLSLEVTLNELIKLQSSVLERFVFQENDFIAQNALDICQHLIHDAVYYVNMSISLWKHKIHDNFLTYVVSDTRTWLSTAITDQETCLDGLMEFKTVSATLHDEMKLKLRNSREYTSNSLAIVSNMFKKFQDPVRKRLLQERWLGGAVLVPNLTIAQDGSGDYRRISDALNAMPKRKEKRFFIYVKEGEYDEKVVVGPDYWNLMIYGDGMNKTIVSGSQSYGDGVATYDSGTLIAEGRGFIAKDMGFKNKAGPKKLQAVAVRSSSDESMFDRCYFDGFQDTLFTHSNRQFYRDCVITGTIDFIFGNAAVVFQNCTIRPRQPGPGQYNTVTAQGKSDPNQNTGISIQQCIISPFDNVTAQTFLGRPWKSYSTTVVMETEIQRIVDPDGWAPWEPNIEVPTTLFYAEHNNTGPGSVTTNRVKWVGYRPNITGSEAEKFSIESLIQGRKWLIL